MKNIFYINKVNECLEKIRNSVFNYQEMIKDMSGEIDKLEMCNTLYQESITKRNELLNKIREYLIECKQDKTTVDIDMLIDWLN